MFTNIRGMEMKNKIAFIMVMGLVISTQTGKIFAEATNTAQPAIKVAFMESIVKDVIKQTIYGVGTQIINKYAGNGTTTNPYVAPYVAPTYVSPTYVAPTYTAPIITTPVVNTQQPVQQTNTPEAMIPVS